MKRRTNRSSTGSATTSTLASVLAVIGLLGAFTLGFWGVNRGEPTDWHDRAQTPMRSAQEEADANKGWNPNQVLSNLEQQIPPPDTWAKNFGQPLAYTKGVDADEFLFPQGQAPAPGTVIDGDDDAGTPVSEPTAEPGAPGNIAAVNAGTVPHAAAGAGNRPGQTPSRRNGNGHSYDTDPSSSPVSGLLNR